MYLFRRLHNKISIYKVPFNFFAPSLRRETQQPTIEENRLTTPASNTNDVLNIISNLEVTLNSVKHNLGQLTDEQTAQIAENTTNFNNIISNIFKIQLTWVLTLTSLNNVDDFHYKINAYFLKTLG